jgi:hypothetical protein
VPGKIDPRHRLVVRLRGRATKQVTKGVEFGFGVASGARGDPNTTDVTLGDFVDKLEVSVDRAYMGWNVGRFSMLVGKFVNPFVRTELVWDDDVSPQGVAGSYTFSRSTRIVPKFTAAYNIVDESGSNPDSFMAGGQMQVRIQPAAMWNLTLAGGYYDYEIRNLAHADSGDILSNRLNSEASRYLSDFNLVNAVAIGDWRGLGERWPLHVTADFVRNLGARSSGEDEGLSTEATIGRASARGDTRYRYGYARAETDAVLAAFSHDNITFATNHVLHTLALDVVASPNTTFNVTWYVFRRDQLQVGPGTGAGQSGDYVSRLRLNALITF